MGNTISQIVAQELQIQRLLSGASLVGGIPTMGFDEVLVPTNDLWKAQAGGVGAAVGKRALDSI